MEWVNIRIVTKLIFKVAYAVEKFRFPVLIARVILFNFFLRGLKGENGRRAAVSVHLSKGIFLFNKV